MTTRRGPRDTLPMTAALKGAVCLALSLIVCGGTALADEGAAEAYERGVDASRSGRHLEASEAFQEAYRLDPNPSLLWNAARSATAGGDVEGARRLYHEYLSHAEAKPARIAQARTWLEDNPEAPPPPQGSVTVLTRPPEASARPALGWTLCGLSMAALVGGTVSFVLASQSRDASFGLSWGADYNETLARHRQLSKEVETRELAAWVSFGAATALLTSGLVVLLAGSESAAAPAAQGLSLGITPTDGGVQASAGWRF